MSLVRSVIHDISNVSKVHNVLVWYEHNDNYMINIWSYWNDISYVLGWYEHNDNYMINTWSYWNGTSYDR